MLSNEYKQAYMIGPVVLQVDSEKKKKKEPSKFNFYIAKL